MIIVYEKLGCPKCEAMFNVNKHQPNLVASCPNCGWDGDFNYPDA